MADEGARDILAETIREARKAWTVKPVQNNAELIKRLDEYFAMAQGRKIPPTVEEMSLYCGYPANVINDWASGTTPGFADQPMPGVTTRKILQRAKTLLHMVDAVLTESNKMNTVAYIFRSKNYYGMVDKQEVTVTPNVTETQALTPEEIAKRLPAADPVLDDDEILSIE